MAGRKRGDAPGDALARELKEARAQQAATAAILKIINRSPGDAQPVFDSIARQARRLLGGHSTAVLLVDGDLLRLAAITSTSKRGDAGLRRFFPLPIAQSVSDGLAIRRRAPICISDTEKHPRLSTRAVARMRGYRSNLVVPLIRGKEALGTISVTRREAGSFNAHEIKLLETFAGQAVIAIENVRSFNEAREALERQTATAEILSVIASSPADVQPVLDAIVRSAKWLVGGHTAAAHHLSDGKLHLSAFTSTTRAGDKALRAVWPAPLRNALAFARAVRSREPSVVEDTEKAHPRLRQVGRARGYRSMIVVPMLKKGTVIGTMSVTRRAPGTFDARQMSLLQTFADQAVIAIENVRLFNETKEALERQTATAEILKVIASSPADVQPVFDAIVQSAARLFRRKTALRVVEAGSLNRRAQSYETGREFHSPEVVPITRDNLVGRVILDGHAAQSADIRTDGTPYARAHADELSFRSIAAAPLIRDGVAIGTIAMSSPEPGALSEKQMELLATFADQAVIAIENVRLFNETKESLERQTATAEILKVIASSPSDVRPVFDAIAASAKRLLSGGAALVARRAGDMLHLAAFTSQGEAADAALQKLWPSKIVGQGHMGKAVLSGGPVLISDIEVEPGYSEGFKAMARTRGLRSIVSVPMLREGEAIGVISVNRPVAGRFSDHQTNLLRTFADQAVIAIENVRLFNETKEALERQTATAEILNVISRSPTDVQPVFECIVRSAMRLTGGATGGLFTSDGAMVDIGWIDHRTDSESAELYRRAYPMPIDRNVPAMVAMRERRVVNLPDLLASDFEEGSKARARAGDYRSLLCVPMLRGQSAIGAVAVTRREPGLFDDRHVSLLQAFADQAVIAIENVRLFNETKEALERQTATAEILKVIASSPSDVQPVFDAIVQSAKRLIDGYSATVSRLVGEQLHLVAFTSTDEAADKSLQASYPRLPRAAQGEAVRTRQPAVISDMQTAAGPSETGREIARARGYRAVVVAPMLRGEEVIGIINVTRREAGPFSDHELELLKTFADQAVIAIENVRLFNETKEALERQTATAEILKVIASSPSDVQPVFDAIAASALRLLGGLGAAVTQVIGDMVHLSAHTATDQTGIEALRAYYPRALATMHATQRVLSSGKPEFRSDIENTPEAAPETKALARLRGYRSSLWVPLLRDGVAFGTINVTRAEVGPFSDHQIKLLETFADQAVIAIENVRLFNETREALERQTATAEILKVIASSPSDIQPVFDVIVQSALRLTDSKLGALFTLDGNLVHLSAAGGMGRDTRGSFRSDYPAPIEYKAPAIQAIRQGRVVNVPDLFEADCTQAVKDRARAGDYRAALIVPMLRDGVAIGSISVTRREPGIFPDKYVSLMQTFADQAVIAIENVRLFNETKESLERQTATGEILSSMSGSMTDAQPVFDAIARNVLRLFGTEFAIVALVRDDTVAIAGLDGAPGFEQLRQRYPVPLNDKTHVGKVILEGKVSQLVPIVGNPDAPPSTEQFARDLGYDAQIGAPMIREGKVIGAIIAARRNAVRFDDKQVALIKSFADQAVIAIENVRLFNETKEALARQTATAEILRVIGGSMTDTQPVFDTIVKNCNSLFDDSRVVLRLVIGEQLHVQASIGSSGGALPIDRTSAAGACVTEGRTIHLPDLEAAAQHHPQLRNLGLKRGERSGVYAPLLRAGKAIGSISVQRRTLGAFSEKEVALLNTFADQAVIAIENVRLFNETKEALEQQTATAEILQVISSSPTDTQPVFEAIVQAGLRLFPNAAVAVVLPEGNKMRMAAVATQLPEQAAAWSAGFQDPLSRDRMHGAAILDGRLVDVPDAETEKDGPLGPGVKNFLAGGNRAITIMPMLCDDTAIGAISVIRRTAGPLSEKQMALLRTFAAQAVIAIENVRVFKELEARTGALTRSVEQLTALGEVGQSISSTLDLDTVLKTIVQRAVQLTRMDGGSIYEYDERSEEFNLRAAENMSDEVVKALRETPARKGEGVIGHAVETGEPTEIAEMLDDSYQSPRRDVLIQAGYRALLVVPLKREDHIIGALAVNRKAPGHFSHEVVELLKTFATQSAMAIQNARLFREIAQKGKELEEASQHKSQFLASMSHELRTPLNAILGFNEMILGQVYGEVPADMQEPLTDIQTSGKHLLRLINNVLDLAKIEAGRMELSLQDYSVQDTVESVRATLRPLAAEKGLEFLVSIPNDLPLAYGDGGRITQCLMNLAGNALKFTKAGKVEISAAAKGELLVYKVSDTGIGIPPDKIGSLFTEFKQTDATIASEYGGTGLGLSISKKFIEMHGGRIWVETELGKGSAFIFEVPLRVKTP